ncbi:DUF6794 domain-containing protein [Undibacterium cyanobacteriorum]|uniref:DUF6794 domain-containing protein n=1 Tax=Undibacterium cyanobacteriorum TaxID=3073561 RepID=A0ABY9RDR3_9BURK|nr:DUF6794 domain-containing protein [Undibacterium sp. 20NA77.5]WMW79319.1 DUF6794 domain-containing protein [Undibacterium sp. 20NA77.5]
MKTLLMICLSASLLACADPVKKTTQEMELAKNTETQPTSCQEVIEKIARKLDEKSRETLRKTKKEGLALFHFSWGMGIRNSFGLWKDQSPVRLSCAERVGQKDIHPDNASGIIMEEVWKLVNSDNISK